MVLIVSANAGTRSWDAMVAGAAGSKQTRRHARKRWQDGADNDSKMVPKWFEHRFKMAPKRVQHISRWLLGGRGPGGAKPFF